MYPAALCSQLERGIADFLRMSFWSSTPGMGSVIERFVTTPGAMLKGPYLSLKLPFEDGGGGEIFPRVPLGHTMFFHQALAFLRLQDPPKNTLVTTGTGSGKTEAFLWPILDYCRQHVGTPGIKAILIYPMNALATDQAERVAEAIANLPGREPVTAGLLLGETPGEKRKTQSVMGARSIITNRGKLLSDPPDILLTNYKMLDYLLVRPRYQKLWQYNKGGPLRFLVVDELHTFDGPQGTDLACLLRRLKARLQMDTGSICCIGTSATLGGGDSAKTLRTYAESVFGEPFDADSVIVEYRQSASDFLGRPEDDLYEEIPDDPAALNPESYPTPEAYVHAQQKLWFRDEGGENEIDAPAHSNAWRVELGEQLHRHRMFRNLVKTVPGDPIDLADALDALAKREPNLASDPKTLRLQVFSLLSLVANARSGSASKPRPLVDVRLQLWQRELRRMVGSFEPEPTLRYHDDLNEDQLRQHLPMIHCRDCGALGWATHQARDKPDVFHTQLPRFYRAFFSFDPQIRFLWPKQGSPENWQSIKLWRNTLIKAADDVLEEADVDPEEVVDLVISPNYHTRNAEREHHRNCPFCAARGSLTLLGYRAATLTSVYIDQLFASRYNNDKKLLTFSDSVQDAAHRAGFFGARTWRFNFRVALLKVAKAHEGATLAELPHAFTTMWKGGSSKDELVRYTASFLAPDMAWLREYDQMREKHQPPEPGLVRLIERRLAYEVFTEYSMQSRIGRSLTRTGSSTAYLDRDKLAAVSSKLRDVLANEVGGLRESTVGQVASLVLGLVHHLRERGGVLHSQLPDEFLATAGGNTYAFKRDLALPSLGKQSRRPVFLTNMRTNEFDNLLQAQPTRWYERWTSRCLQPDKLMGSPRDIWQVAIKELTAAGVLKVHQTKGGTVWGLDPAALRISTKLCRMRCDCCQHWMVVAEAEVKSFDQLPCLTGRCAGSYQNEGDPSDNYFARLYQRGEVERVFAEEHTGLLGRNHRQQVEEEFKQIDNRKPWFPNLLSCTPTLEMGINIGALSSAILCSVPPAQANYLQRVGRTGRRDGNSLLLTLAQGKQHDLYFYADPERMMAGDVEPPGVFLNASAVLERQLAAFTLDCWNADDATTPSIPEKLSRVFDQLEPVNPEKFPHNWIRYIEANQTSLLRDFIELFEGRFSESTKTHLATYLHGGSHDKESLTYRLLVLLHDEKKQRKSLKDKANQVKKNYDKLSKAIARDKDHDKTLAELKNEETALRRLVEVINKTRVIEFLTDQGFLPNYAFPESPSRLRSVIWRRKSSIETAGKAPDKEYETQVFEYARPAMSAISEFAPANQFFAGGRQVTIDQVDVGSAKIEQWRFCINCTYSKNITSDDHDKDCPRCQDPSWGESSQRRQLLRLGQVFARSSDRDARIGDDRDERQPKHYNRNMVAHIPPNAQTETWALDDDKVPFGFEYIPRATFREVNFGEYTDEGETYTIAGQQHVRQGFTICSHCGKVQPKEGREANQTERKSKEKHTKWCPVDRKASFETAVYLYREFHSEALRLLLPLTNLTTEQQSFMAAFQLGLREKYGGRVDHIHTLIYDEPEADSLLRRQYLVLYDTVPGGTGYLKDFVQVDEATGRHVLFDILQRALTRMQSCACIQEGNDGCYRCVYAYRNSRDQKATSRTEAVKQFQRLLDLETKLIASQGLSTISVQGMFDSVLEVKFIEALRNFEGKPISVEKTLVHGKPGFKLHVDNKLWNIEPQRNLQAKDGFIPGVSIDFVLHPLTDANTPGVKPIAVFLDGFRYHRDRVGYDMLQRMTLLASGKYDVYTLTWQDIEHPKSKPIDALLNPTPQKFAAVCNTHSPGSLQAVQESMLTRLVKTLADPQSELIVANKTRQLLLVAQNGQHDPATWLGEITEHAPPALAGWFKLPGPGLVVGRPPTDTCPFGLWATFPKQDPNTNHRVLVWLDDRDECRAKESFNELWRGFLFAVHHLRGFKHAWFITARGQAELDYVPLSQTRDAPDPATAGWDLTDVDESVKPLTAKLIAANVPQPDVYGEDLPDPRGRACGLVGELTWTKLKVAVVEDLEEADVPPDPAWTIFALADLEHDLSPLLQALNVANKGS